MNKHHPNRTACSLAIVAILASPLAQANLGGPPGGHHGEGAFQALGTDEIEMRSEILAIRLRDMFAELSIEYDLHNPGKATTVRAGFPASTWTWPAYSKEPKKKKPTLPGIYDYRIEVDGKEIESKLIRDSEPKQSQDHRTRGRKKMDGFWFASDIGFSKEQTRRVRITCKAAYFRYWESVSDDVSFGETILNYRLSTAAVWKGPIRKGRIVIIPDGGIDPRSVKVRPQGRFTSSGQGANLVWEFENLDPTLADDLRIQVREPEHQYPARKRSGKRAELAGYYIVRKNDYFFQHAKFTATASSTLDPKKHAPSCIADYRRNTAWIESAEGDGVGETISVTLKDPAPIALVEILPGFADSKTAFEEKNRIKRLGVTVNGEHRFDVEFLDVNDYQQFSLHGYATPVRTIDLTVKGVYPGSKSQDTCISHLAVRQPLSKKPAISPAR